MEVGLDPECVAIIFDVGLASDFDEAGVGAERTVNPFEGRVEYCSANCIDGIEKAFSTVRGWSFLASEHRSLERRWRFDYYSDEGEQLLWYWNVPVRFRGVLLEELLVVPAAFPRTHPQGDERCSLCSFSADGSVWKACGACLASGSSTRTSSTSQ